MRICDVVKNSVWYDPRVRKQLLTYAENRIEVFCVGVRDLRFDATEVARFPADIRLVDTWGSGRPHKTILGKIRRELASNLAIYKEIVSGQPDLIHANDLNALIPAYFASRRLQCRLVYDTHEIFLENPWIARNKLIKFVWGFFEKRIIHKVDLVVCVSHAAGEYLQKKYQIPAPMVVTNCIRESDRVTGTPEKHEPKEILNHGQFYEGRGYETMILAAPLLAKHSDLQIVVRGLGPKEAELRQLAEEVASPNFRLDPPVRVSEMIPEASKAWLGVAITEPISVNFELSVSNKLFEYAAAGLPVLMSDIPEHRYLNNKYQFGVVLEENTPEAIAKGVERFYFDRDFYAVCAENASKMSEEICWERVFKELISKEEDLCNI